jgi:hypothetical protein
MTNDDNVVTGTHLRHCYFPQTQNHLNHQNSTSWHFRIVCGSTDRCNCVVAINCAHVILPVNEGAFTTTGLVHGNQVLDFCKGLVPDSIRVEVPIQCVLSPPGGLEMIVFLICYCGEHLQLTRTAADSYRDTLEAVISKHVMLKENRKGWPVSCPFPHLLLQQLIAKHSGDYLFRGK